MRIRQVYSLLAKTVDMVRRLVEKQQVAPSQDALVERAPIDFFMAVRYEQEARQFAQAATDPEILEEVALLEREFAGRMQ